MAITFNPANMGSAEGKAREYNRLLKDGYSDAAIKQAADAQFGAQSAGDWAYLRGLAQQQSMTPAQLANLQASTAQQKAQAYLGGLAGGKTDEQVRMEASGLFGMQSDADWNVLKGVAQNLTAEQKAQVYNANLGRGLTDAQIRANINQNLGQQSDADWQALTNLATTQRGGGGGGGGGGGEGGNAATGGANPYTPQTLGNPFTYTPSPYLGEMANTIRQQVTDNLQRNILPGIGSAAIAAGGYGGSRQGVVEANALKDANTGLSGALSNLYGQDYNNAMSRNLQRYQADQGYNLGVGNLGLGFQNSAQNFALGLGGLANQRYGQDQNFALGVGNLGVNAYQAQTTRDLGTGNLGLGYYNAANNYALGAGNLGLGYQNSNQNYALGLGNLGLGYQNSLQNFYTAQRGQDMQGVQLGANLFQQGNTGMQQQGQGLYNLGLTQQQAPWSVVGNYTNTVSPFTGFGNTTNATPGNAGAGALGGALVGAQLYNLFNKP
jgi:hypothetical protein